MNKYYLRIQGEKFGFVVEGIHEIDGTIDHELTQEEYNKFFELQGEGKQFRLKENPTGDMLFDYLEEYEPEPLSQGTPSELDLIKEEVLNQSEMILDMDFRMTSLELGL
ncbi:MAG: hypothetical protein E6585_23985 [Serratia marcescens]|nr:hypothetical protein [Serratia marcescens]